MNDTPTERGLCLASFTSALRYKAGRHVRGGASAVRARRACRRTSSGDHRACMSRDGGAPTRLPFGVRRHRRRTVDAASLSTFSGTHHQPGGHRSRAAVAVAGAARRGWHRHGPERRRRARDRGRQPRHAARRAPDRDDIRRCGEDVGNCDRGRDRGRLRIRSAELRAEISARPPARAEVRACSGEPGRRRGNLVGAEGVATSRLSRTRLSRVTAR